MNVWGPTQTHFLSVLTQSWKYNYWWYKGEGMEPAEELYHLSQDPLELNNLSPANKQALESHRKLYDQAIDHWKQNAPQHYQPYATNFDRNLPWTDKQNTLSQKKKNQKQ